MYLESKINLQYIGIYSALLVIFFIFSSNPSLVYSSGVVGLYFISILSGLCVIALIYFSDNNKKYIYSRYAIAIFSLFIAPKIMSRPLAFDDWSYIGMGISENPVSGFFYPINDHVVPVLNLILTILDKWFYTSPLPFQLALVFSNFLLIVSIEKICKHFDFDSKSILIVLLIFVFSPSLIGARLWFAGGFWLTLTTSFLLVLFIQVDNLIKSNVTLWRDVFYTSITVLLLVGTATQYKLVVLNVLPILLWGLIKEPQNKKKIIFIFFALSAFGVNYVIDRLSGQSNELGGIGIVNIAFNIIANLGYWIEAQFFSLVNGVNHVLPLAPWDPIPPVSSSFSAAVVVGVFFLISYAVYLTYLKRSGKYFFVSLLFIYNCILFVTEVGLGRGWDYNRILTGYYQIFPVVMLLLSLVPLFGLIVSKIENKNIGVMPVIFLFGLFFISINSYMVTRLDLSLLYKQKIFIDEFSEAVCSVAKDEKKSRLLLNPGNKFDKCDKCSYLMQAPSLYLDHLSRGSQYFLIAKQLSRSSCPENYYKYLIWMPKADPIYDAFTGPLEWKEFNKKYFN